VPLALVPFLGLLVSPIAVFVNRRASGWPKVTSWIGATIALLFTTVAIIGITVSARSKPPEQNKPRPVHVGRQK
jgi:hypothetical protein